MEGRDEQARKEEREGKLTYGLDMPKAEAWLASMTEKLPDVCWLLSGARSVHVGGAIYHQLIRRGRHVEVRGLPSLQTRFHLLVLIFDRAARAGAPGPPRAWQSVG